MFTPSRSNTSAKLIGLAALTLCASSLPGATQVAVGKPCNASKLSVAQLAGTQRETASVQLRSLARFNITQGKAGCVLVNVVGEFVTDTNTALFMSAKLDTLQGPIQEVVFNINESETRSAAFLFEKVPAGAHTVFVQWRSSDAGQKVIAGDTVIWVHYVP